MKTTECRRLHFNFKTKLILMISIFNISLVLCVSGFNYAWHSGQLTRQTASQTRQIIEQTGANIDNYIDELFRLTLAPYYNDEIMEEIAVSAVSPEKILQKKRTIEDFLSSVMTLPRNEVLRVYILTDEDIYSYTRTPYQMEDYDSYPDSDWYRRALSSNAPVFIPVHAEKAYGERRTQIFSVARRLRSKENNRILLGVVRVDADYTGIKTICDKVNFENEGSLFVVNADGEPVYENNRLSDGDILNRLPAINGDGDFSFRISGERYLVNSTLLSESGLRIIAVHSYDGLTRRARAYLNRTVCLALACILVSTIGLVLFIRRFLHPLFHIIASMKLVRTGDLSVQMPVEKQDEIGYLASAFNDMTGSLKSVMGRNAELMREVYEAQYLHKVSQYDALCAQIRPHFLYNTLNTISLLIKCNESGKAVRCIEDLSRCLRGIMNTDKEISLAEELSLVRAYLNLQKIRYQDRLVAGIRADESIPADIRIPALSLQPLAENAVKHCCESCSRPVHIDILAAVWDDTLALTVTDDGPGMAPETLSIIRSGLESGGPDAAEPGASSGKDSLLNESLGLLNVHKRLKLRFGSSAGLTLSSGPAGTTVILKIPLRQNVSPAGGRSGGPDSRPSERRPSNV